MKHRNDSREEESGLASDLSNIVLPNVGFKPFHNLPPLTVCKNVQEIQSSAICKERKQTPRIRVTHRKHPQPRSPNKLGPCLGCKRSRVQIPAARPTLVFAITYAISIIVEIAPGPLVHIASVSRDHADHKPCRVNTTKGSPKNLAPFCAGKCARRRSRVE